jgi:hypothetical protein
MVKKLHPTAIVPQNVSTNEQIRAGFHEVLTDLNAIISQWNDTIHPLIDSLPGGRTRFTPAQRSETINPVDNGFDGSQVFMDQTSTPQILSGFLYNARLKRPKTIKEVVLDSHIALQSEVSKLRSLVDGIEAADTTYDDTDLRNWIRRLAADTISDLDQGDPFGTGYFGDPTKTAQYSLHQRDANLRTLIGIDSDDYGLTNPGFDGTNYIDDMDIIDALIELDSHISEMDPATTTLQDAYDRGNTIETTSGRPITITTASYPTTPLTVTNISGATAMSVAGNLALFSGSTLVGILGENGHDDALYLRQEDGMNLAIGNTDGNNSIFGEYTSWLFSAYGAQTYPSTDIDFFVPAEGLGGLTRVGGIGGVAESVLDTTLLNTGLMFKGDFFEATGTAPSGQENGAEEQVWPQLNRLYTDNIIKAKCAVYNNANDASPSSTLLDGAFNIFDISHVDKGVVSVSFGTPLPEGTSFCVSVENVGRKGEGGGTPCFCTEVNTIDGTGEILGVTIIVQAISDGGGGALVIGKPQVDINIYLQAV